MKIFTCIAVYLLSLAFGFAQTGGTTSGSTGDNRGGAGVANTAGSSVANTAGTGVANTAGTGVANTAGTGVANTPPITERSITGAQDQGTATGGPISGTRGVIQDVAPGGTVSGTGTIREEFNSTARQGINAPTTAGATAETTGNANTGIANANANLNANGNVNLNNGAVTNNGNAILGPAAPGVPRVIQSQQNSFADQLSSAVAITGVTQVFSPQDNTVITVTSQNGTVTVQGFVRDPRNAQAIENFLNSVNGVRTVHNRLQLLVQTPNGTVIREGAGTGTSTTP